MGISEVKKLQINSATQLKKTINKKQSHNNHLTFMDFCSGIGGGRLALNNLGMQCVGFSEIDKNAEKTYRLLFNDKSKNFGDLTKINADKLPNFDMMIAGFPCQAFSVLGNRKGIYDKVQKKGEIIFYLIELLMAKSVKFFIFENVKGLINHDKGQTLKIILDELDKANYCVKWKLLNSLDYGVPQMRERIYFVGVQKEILGDNEFNFDFPTKQKQPNVTDFLIDDAELIFDSKTQPYKTFTKYLNNKYNKNKFNIPTLLNEESLVIDTRQSDLRKYYNKVPTLRLGRHGILYVKNGKFRKLSGYESLLLQGFTKDKAQKAKDNILDRHLLKQAGNAMTVNTVQAVAYKTLEFINNLKIRNNKNDKQKLGSKTAKDGYKNEHFVIHCFNNWKNNNYGKKWLKAMDYHLEQIEFVKAHKIIGTYKSDIQIKIRISVKLKHLTDVQNLQVKLVSNKSGFNQIDKRWVETYQKLWNMPNNVAQILKYFTGELPPYNKNIKDNRRMFINELSKSDQNILLNFLHNNKTLIVSDILKGRGEFSAKWILVIIRDQKPIKWVLKSINIVLNFFGNGDIKISPKGSITIGKITMQRKGGDADRPSANMLQFKIDPTELLN